MSTGDPLKLIGATEAELQDPRVQAALADLELAESAPARALTDSILAAAPADPPAAANQHGLERYGLKLRRKTNVHDMFIQRIIGFGEQPDAEWVAQFKAEPKTATKPVPPRIIPTSYMPSVFIFILAAPFRTVEAALAVGEAAKDFYAFFEKVDEWVATTGLPTNKTEEVWTGIMESFKGLEQFQTDAGDVLPDTGHTTVKKTAAPTTSSGTP